MHSTCTRAAREHGLCAPRTSVSRLQTSTVHCSPPSPISGSLSTLQLHRFSHLQLCPSLSACPLSLPSSLLSRLRVRHVCQPASSSSLRPPLPPSCTCSPLSPPLSPSHITAPRRRGGHHGSIPNAQSRDEHTGNRPRLPAPKLSRVTPSSPARTCPGRPRGHPRPPPPGSVHGTRGRAAAESPPAAHPRTLCSSMRARSQTGRCAARTCRSRTRAAAVQQLRR